MKVTGKFIVFPLLVICLVVADVEPNVSVLADDVNVIPVDNFKLPKIVTAAVAFQVPANPVKSTFRADSLDEPKKVSAYVPPVKL